MAWRIDEHVVRGEIDNRTRGRVVGKIWFAGRAEPVELDLAGNCWRDLAGRRLVFTNPQPQPGLPDSLAPRQDGVVGDITASRKVKVPDIPLDQLHLYYKTGHEMPWHWGNALYLEWFSSANGRIVIETASFELKVDGESAWEMSEAEEAGQRRANGEALTGFMDRLNAAAAGGELVDDTPAEWDEEPLTEAEAEAMQARSDLLSDRIAARLEREGDDADFERIMDEEMARLRRERGEPEPTEEELARSAEWIDELNAAAEETLANPDPELEESGREKHPLAERVHELTLQLHGSADDERWIPEGAPSEHPVQALLDATMCAGAKLAGALNGGQWPPDLEISALTIVRLKKARDYLDDAVRALESCQEEKLLTPAQMGPVLAELTDAIMDTDALIAALRARLERGTE